jgi:hypothetical protein
VQHFPLLRVDLCSQYQADESFDPDHLFIAGGQGADADEDLAQVCKGLALGQFVECVVGQCPAAGSKIGEHGCYGLLVQPAHGGDRVFGGGDVVPQRLQPGVQRFRGWTEDFAEALVDQAAAALARMRVGGVVAGWAVVPDFAGGAVLAAWLGAGARDDGRRLSARTASCSVVLAVWAPRPPGDSGCAARSFLTADRASRDRQGRAAPADRPVRCSEADRASSTAVEADFEVVRVGDQAVRTQRPTVAVTGRRFATRPAACAFLDAGVRDTGAADPLPIEGFVDLDDAMAPRTRRQDDAAYTRGVKRVDQRHDRAHGREMTGTGEQLGLGFQRPADLSLVRGPGCELMDRRRDYVAVSGWIQLGDHVVDDRDRIALIAIGTLGASGLSGAITGRHALLLAAGGTSNRAPRKS